MERGFDYDPWVVVDLVRAGIVLDPLGRTADELAAALADGHADAATIDADTVFAGKLRALDVQAGRIAAARRDLLAEQVDRGLAGADAMDVDTRLKELATIGAATIRVSDRSIQRAMDDAWCMIRHLPLTHASAGAGRISTAHMYAISDLIDPLRADPGATTDTLRRVEAQLVAIAEETTPIRLRRRGKKLVDAALTTPLQQRYDHALQQRGVWLRDTGGGMCEITAHLPAIVAAAIIDRLTQAARALPADDPRRIDQRRADAFTELLLCGQTPENAHLAGAITPIVSVTMPATLLTGDHTSDQAVLDSGVVIDAATARTLAGGQRDWERLFLSPITGLATATDRYRPTAAQRRWLRARDGRCRFPGCGLPARATDVDHTLDYADGGITDTGNLSHLCRRHHVIKHTTRWKVTQPTPGVLEWVSPTGQIIRDEPDPAEPPEPPPPPIKHEPWGTATSDAPPDGYPF